MYQKMLVIEDNEEVLLLYRKFLEGSDWDLVDGYADLFHTPNGVIGLIENSGPFELALFDLEMPIADSIELLETFRKLSPNCPVMVASGYVYEFKPQLKALGIDTILEKPFSQDLFLENIKRLTGK